MTASGIRAKVCCPDAPLGPSGLNGVPFVASWSGGKDSCLALHRATQLGGLPRCLLTVLDESGARSHSHGLPPDLIERQAESMGIPVVFMRAGWGDYENEFIRALAAIRERGVRAAVFGDIDLEPHREWCRKVCAAAGLAAIHPLWQQARKDLLLEFVRLGYRARIVSIRLASLKPDLLGRTIDEQAIAELEACGIDPSGELGEYHTFVTDGPMFALPVAARQSGAAENCGYLFSILDPA